MNVFFPFKLECFCYGVMGSTNKKELPPPAQNEPYVRIVTRNGCFEGRCFMKMSVYNQYKSMSMQELLVKYILLKAMGLNSDVSIVITLDIRELDVPYSMMKFNRYYERVKRRIEKRYIFPRNIWFNDKAIELDPSPSEYINILCDNINTPVWDVNFSVTRGGVGEFYTFPYPDDIIELLILPLFLALQASQCELFLIGECPELRDVLLELDQSIQASNPCHGAFKLGDGRVISRAIDGKGYPSPFAV
jgi:hypothetical protein